MPLATTTTERIQRARLAYPPSEAAALLGISRAKLYELITAEPGESPVIPSVKIGKSRRVRHEALVAYLDSCSAAAA